MRSIMEMVRHVNTFEKEVGLLDLLIAKKMLAITEDPPFNIEDETDMEREVDKAPSTAILYELFRGKKVLQTCKR